MNFEKVICKEVIVTRIATRGDGVKIPIRTITQVYEKTGELIAENDCEMYKAEDMQKFGEWCCIRRRAMEPISNLTIREWKEDINEK